MSEKKYIIKNISEELSLIKSSDWGPFGKICRPETETSGLNVKNEDKTESAIEQARRELREESESMGEDVTWTKKGEDSLLEQFEKEHRRQEEEQAREEIRKVQEEQVRQIHEVGIKKFKDNFLKGMERDVQKPEQHSLTMDVSLAEEAEIKDLKVQVIKLDEEDISHLIDFLNGVGRETNPSKREEEIKKKSLKKLSKQIVRVLDIIDEAFEAYDNQDYEQIKYFTEKLKTFK